MTLFANRILAALLALSLCFDSSILHAVESKPAAGNAPVVTTQALMPEPVAARFRSLLKATPRFDLLQTFASFRRLQQSVVIGLIAAMASNAQSLAPRLGARLPGLAWFQASLFNQNEQALIVRWVAPETRAGAEPQLVALAQGSTERRRALLALALRQAEREGRTGSSLIGALLQAPGAEALLWDLLETEKAPALQARIYQLLALLASDPNRPWEVRDQDTDLDLIVRGLLDVPTESAGRALVDAVMTRALDRKPWLLLRLVEARAKAEWNEEERRGRVLEDVIKRHATLNDLLASEHAALAVFQVETSLTGTVIRLAAKLPGERTIKLPVKTLNWLIEAARNPEHTEAVLTLFERIDLGETVTDAMLVRTVTDVYAEAVMVGAPNVPGLERLALRVLNHPGAFKLFQVVLQNDTSSALKPHYTLALLPKVSAPWGKDEEFLKVLVEIGAEPHVTGRVAKLMPDETPDAITLAWNRAIARSENEEARRLDRAQDLLIELKKTNDPKAPLEPFGLRDLADLALYPMAPEDAIIVWRRWATARFEGTDAFDPRFMGAVERMFGSLETRDIAADLAGHSYPQLPMLEAALAELLAESGALGPAAEGSPLRKAQQAYLIDSRRIEALQYVFWHNTGPKLRREIAVLLADHDANLGSPMGPFPRALPLIFEEGIKSKWVGDEHPWLDRAKSAGFAAPALRRLIEGQLSTPAALRDDAVVNEVLQTESRPLVSFMTEIVRQGVTLGERDYDFASLPKLLTWATSTDPTSAERAPARALLSHWPLSQKNAQTFFESVLMQRSIARRGGNNEGAEALLEILKAQLKRSEALKAFQKLLSDTSDPEFRETGRTLLPEAADAKSPSFPTELPANANKVQSAA
jgi:hypothetical protein